MRSSRSRTRTSAHFTTSVRRYFRIPNPESRVPNPVPIHYLVMEHLAGESLAERLLHGPLPLAQALDIGAQIAEALDAAHKHGIIHRDLKPGNVMLTGGGSGRSGVTSAKLLDFGLAKLVAHGERPALASDASASTRTVPMTARGAIVGTLQYMAPEQLEGREADARTDLWALGALLYEMLTGKRAFQADSDVSLIGAILNTEPAGLATQQPLTPPALERVVTKCLAKHPDDRWDTAHDVADELRWISQTSGAAAGAGIGPRRGRRSGFIAGAVLAGVMIGAGVMWLLSSHSATVSLARLSLDVRPAEELSAGGASLYRPTPGGSRTALTWTPDARALVFVGRRGGVPQLYVRRLDAAEARPLAGTEGAQVPAVSPDGQWVAFWARGVIEKVPLAGGPITELMSHVDSRPFGLAWNADGGLFFDQSDNRIWKIPASGTPAAVTTLADGEAFHVLPRTLPDGKVLLYTVRNRFWSWGDEQIVAQTLATGTRKVLLTDAADARYVPTGHLVFLRRGQLFAVPFDANRVEVRGRIEAVLDGVAQALTAGNSDDVTGAGQFAVATSGMLAWLPGPVATYPDATLVTVDRRGQVTPLPAPVRSYDPWVRLSPDGRRLVVSSKTLTDVSLWTYDLSRGTLTTLSTDGEASWPVWGPDGQRVLFKWIKAGRYSLAALAADGSSPAQVLLAGEPGPSSITPDGREVAACDFARDNDMVLVAFGGGPARVQPLGPASHHGRWPAFSPDGRWLAYGSGVSGRIEIYVQPYPGSGAAELVSIEGGLSPAWNPNGRELFFVGNPLPKGKWRMMAVDFAPGSPPRIGRPHTLFEFELGDLGFMCSPLRCYDVAPDGQRFYAVRHGTPPPPPVVTHISLIQNWFEELKAKVPAGGAK